MGVVGGSVGKTLGLTSTGPVTKYLIDYLTTNNANSSDQLLQREFFKAIEEVVILFDPERHYQPPVLGKGTDGRDLEERVTERIGLRKVEGFNALYQTPHVLVDCSADLGLQSGEARAGNIPNYLQPILNQKKYNPEKLYPDYVKQLQAGNRKPLSPEKFAQRLSIAAKVVNILQELKADGHELEGKCLNTIFPIYFPLMLERAALVQELLKSGWQKKAEQDLPVSIMVTNEPTMLSNLFSYVNPRLQDRLIASNGVDRQRLLTKAYESCQEYAGRPQDLQNLEFSIFGAHDSQLSLARLRVKDGATVQCVVPQLRNHLQERLDAYLAGERKPEIWLEVSRALTQVIVSAAQSWKKGLSLSPQEGYLCDGYYHHQAGLFLSGEYQLGNGFIVPREKQEELYREGRAADEESKVQVALQELWQRLRTEVVDGYLKDR